MTEPSEAAMKVWREAVYAYGRLSMEGKPDKAAALVIDRAMVAGEPVAALSMDLELKAVSPTHPAPVQGDMDERLNITNADHIAVWLEANIHDSSLPWLACRIIEAHEAAFIERIEQIGWPEINAFQDELRKGQDIREDAGGRMLRAIKALFGFPSRSPVQTYQSAARALIAQHKGTEHG